MLEVHMKKILTLVVLLPLLSVCTAFAEMPSDQADLPNVPGTFNRDHMLARTARGEVPSAVVYEDDDVLAFLGDYPAAEGHFLVVSKTVEARSFLDFTPEQLARILAVAQLVARAEIVVMGAEGFTLRLNNSSTSHSEFFHLHVIPRWKDDQLKSGPADQVSLESLEPLAKKIRDQIAVMR